MLNQEQQQQQQQQQLTNPITKLFTTNRKIVLRLCNFSGLYDLYCLRNKRPQACRPSCTNGHYYRESAGR